MKKIIYLFSMVLVASVITMSCGGGEPAAKVDNQISKDIDSATFKKMMEEGKLEAIDIRGPKERYADNIFKKVNKPYGFIPGTKYNVDWNNKTFKTEIQKLDKSKPYGIYCRSGNRSGKALWAMKAMGFKEVYNLDHGMKGWLKAGYETEVVPVPVPEAAPEAK